MSAAQQYRPEIDGLRTIAVLSVLVFHAEFVFADQALLTGGFIGVDVFFVISGYLISSIILRELQNGRFSFADFYERRARRILPILFTVILVSTPMAWFYLLPRAMSEYGVSVITSVFFSSNFWFWSQDPYWATESALKPFLHTWSLAVEEQFYLVTPFLLILIHRARFFVAFLALVALAAVSLVLAEITSRTHPSFAFYMLPTRFWELLSGTMLALLELRRGAPRSSSLTAPLTSLGLVLILVPCVLFNEATRHPSVLTLIPIAGTCLIVWFARGDDLISRLLASRLFVGIGLISYGLYMWHFPVFVFGQLAIDDEPGNLVRLVWIVFSLGLATLSFFTIERPFRNRATLSRRRLVVGLSGLVLPGIAFAVVAINSDGLKTRFDELRRLYGPAEFDNALLQAQSWSLVRSDDRKALSLENPFPADDTVNVLITGDSHSKDAFNMFVLNPDLYPGLAFNKYSASVTEKDDSCFLDNPGALSDFVNSQRFKQSHVILISERFRNRPVQLQCLERYIDLLKREGKKVILTSLSNVYRRESLSAEGLGHFTRLFLKVNRPTLADKYLLLQDKNTNTLTAFEHRYFERRSVDEIENTNEALKKIATGAAVDFLSKQDYQCDTAAKRCDLLTPEGRKLNYDSSHYTLEGARYFGRKAVEIGWFQQTKSLSATAELVQQGTRGSE